MKLAVALMSLFIGVNMAIADPINYVARLEGETPLETWRRKATYCPVHPTHLHNFIPITWSVYTGSKHVSMLMCMYCFHEINIGEAFEYRKKLE